MLESSPPLSFFGGYVRDAVKRQRAPLSESAQQYLTETLASLEAEESPERGRWAIPSQPLVEMLFDAEARRRATSWFDPDFLRTVQVVGNASLVLAGFFPERCEAAALGVRSFVRIGRRAFIQLRAQPFKELTHRFPHAVAVVREVSVRCAVQEDGGLVRVYRAWLESRDPLLGRILEERGVTGPRN